MSDRDEPRAFVRWMAGGAVVQARHPRVDSRGVASGEPIDRTAPAEGFIEQVRVLRWAGRAGFTGGDPGA